MGSSEVIVSDGKKPFRRLPNKAIPINYDIFVEPNWEDVEPVNYFCKTAITINVKEPVNEILLNSIGALISKVTYEYLSSSSDEKMEGEIINVAEDDYKQNEEDKESEIICIRFRDDLSKGRIKLTLEFTTEYCDVAGLGMKGMYRSKYQGPDGSDRFNYLTFFAPTYARNCFPCYDEPEYKATFDISLVVPHGRVAASNMPLKSEEPYFKNPEFLTLKKFETSPKMSTYLAAWIMGDFDCLEETSTDDVKCRVYTPLGKKEQGAFAMDVASKSLSFYKHYFNIAYPLPKLDMAALGDFPCGAMENWGLVTFRETALLVDEKQTSFRNRQTIGLTTSHEIAHSWFGNLVTMRWWTDLWLNEGFATFVEFLCIDQLFSDWNIWTQFGYDIMIPALELDSLSSSHPIEVDVKNPSDIDEIFDVISYMKGASIIRMLYNWIGDENFRKGVSSYLKKYQYSNAETKDLWSELETSSGQEVGKVMTTWTKQKGYPLLTVSNIKRNGLEIEMMISAEPKPFHLEACNKTIQDESPQQEWYVPLTFYKYGGGDDGVSDSEETVVLKVSPDLSSSTKHVIKMENDSQRFKLNKGGIGFYRVKYEDSDDIWEKHFEAVENKRLSPLDRLNLIDDSFAIVKSGGAETISLIQFLRAYKEEDDYSVWCVISRIFDELIQLLSETQDRKRLDEIKAFGRYLFQYRADHLTWDAKKTDKPMDPILRGLVIRKMVEFEDSDYIAEGKRRFQAYKQGEDVIGADLRSAVYKSALFGANQTVIDNFLEMYRSTDLLEKKLSLLGVMDSVKGPDLLAFLLNFSLTKEVRNQDAVKIIAAVSASGYEGRRMAWTFFKENWSHFQKHFTGLFIIGQLVKGITTNFASKEMEEDVKSFFKQFSFRGTDMTVNQSLESIRIKMAWIERDFNKNSTPFNIPN